MFSLASHCWGHIPKSEPLKDALDLFERMIKRNDLSRQNLCILTELLTTISRIDLVEELETQEFEGWYFLVYVTDVSLNIFRSLPITVLTLLFISITAETSYFLYLCNGHYVFKHFCAEFCYNYISKIIGVRA